MAWEPAGPFSIRRLRVSIVTVSASVVSRTNWVSVFPSGEMVSTSVNIVFPDFLAMSSTVRASTTRTLAVSQ